MTDTLQITVEDAQVQRWFGELVRRGTDLSGLMADLGEALLESTQVRFAAGIAPDGVAGSSPRARGTDRSSSSCGLFGRFIPACAGNRCRPARLRLARPVHPRVRGEQEVLERLTLGYGRFIPACAGNSPRPSRSTRAIFGSSPRARGTVLSAQAAIPEQRFIPACAGNSPPSTTGCCPSTVHPRVRGEQVGPPSPSSPSVGSSPRARGTGQSRTCRGLHSRFIPACAGNSPVRLRHTSRPSVHPRVRGEQASTSFCQRPLAGSSACAGNRRRPALRRREAPVHPRVRGEQETLRPILREVYGSSPRARGTGANPARRALEHRFIPACAGNSATASATAATRAVHPRVRGEQAAVANPRPTGIGSSPRARGTAHAAPPAGRGLRGSSPRARGTGRRGW